MVTLTKAKGNHKAKQKQLVHSRQQDAVLSILRTANYLRSFCSPVFDQHDITSQQFNVLRILLGAGLEGLPTLDIAGRMIEQAPGITRLLDRLERKKLVRRERPSDNRRQVLCYITKPGLDLLQELTRCRIQGRARQPSVPCRDHPDGRVGSRPQYCWSPPPGRE
jgi:DNA-binding MarR family transcriptional regulator